MIFKYQFLINLHNTIVLFHICGLCILLKLNYIFFIFCIYTQKTFQNLQM